jgi:hypothetical protein
MTWRTLFLTSLCIAAIAIAALNAIFPAPAESQDACGNFSDRLCHSHCTAICPNGSCCGWAYDYYRKPPM